MTLSIGYPVQIKGTDFVGEIASQSVTDGVYLVKFENLYRADQLDPLTTLEASNAAELKAAHADEVFRLTRALEKWSNARYDKSLRLKITESLERLGLTKVEEPVAVA